MFGYIWVLIFVGLCLLIFNIVGLIMALGTIKSARRSLLETAILESEKFEGIMDFYNKNLTDKYVVSSRYGYNLQVYYLKNKIKTNDFIIMSHGHTYTHHGLLKYARMMMKYGFNILMYDQRYHGASGGSFTSLGHYEQYDLYDLVTHVYNKFGKEIYLGTYGESMGAATVLLEAKIDNRIKFVMSDSAFSNFHDLTLKLMKNNYHIPKVPFFFFANLYFRIFTGINFKGISPIEAINQLNIPIFFAHGKADNIIPYTQSVNMYDSYSGPKKLFIGSNESLHVESYLKDRENYEKAVDDFVTAYLNL